MPVFNNLSNNTATIRTTNITTIQHLLGHTSPCTTQTYAEESQENLQHEYNQHFIQ